MNIQWIEVPEAKARFARTLAGFQDLVAIEAKSIDWDAVDGIQYRYPEHLHPLLSNEGWGEDIQSGIATGPLTIGAVAAAQLERCSGTSATGVSETKQSTRRRLIGKVAAVLGGAVTFLLLGPGRIPDAQAQARRCDCLESTRCQVRRNMCGFDGRIVVKVKRYRQNNPFGRCTSPCSEVIECNGGCG